MWKTAIRTSVSELFCFTVEPLPKIFSKVYNNNALYQHIVQWTYCEDQSQCQSRKIMSPTHLDRTASPGETLLQLLQENKRSEQELSLGFTVCLVLSPHHKSPHWPAERFAGEALPGSYRWYFLRALLGARTELLCRWHFFTVQGRDFLSPCMSASLPLIFFRKRFSTYLDLIQASFSCLEVNDHKKEGKRYL